MVEVLVTVTLATILVAGVYMIYNKSVLAFRVENQVMTMQDRLRFGLEHLKRDIRRAGFLATPNSLVDSNICPPPSAHLRAVTIAANDDGNVVLPVVLPGINVNLEPSSITLFGDFFSGQVYRTTGIVGDLVYFEATPNFPTTKLEFDRIFCGATCVKPNRYLRIVTRDQFEVMLPIIDVEYASATGTYVELSQNVPRIGGGNRCGITGLGEGLEVNVAGFVRYRIAFDIRSNAPTNDNDEPLKTDLIREELDIDGDTVMSGTQLVIADYATDLQFYDFGFDISGPSAVPLMQYYPLVTDVLSGANTGVLNDTANATPETLRIMTVKLTLRGSEEDPSHLFSPRSGAFMPIEAYDLDDELQGSCRTLSLACKMGLSSLLARNLNSGGP